MIWSGAHVPGWIGHWSVWREVADHKMNLQRCFQPPEYAVKTHIMSIYIYAFSRRFYPKQLTVHSGYTFIVCMCVPWELNPQPFVLLTQCSTTEPQEPWATHLKKISPILNTTTAQKFGGFKVFKEVSCAYQGWLYLIINTVKTVILWNIIII